jgi:hypothetical protein
MSGYEPAELEALAEEIETAFAGRWRFVGVARLDGEHALAAETIATIPQRQTATTPEKLLSAISWYEANYRPREPVAVAEGLVHTDTD